MENFDISVHCSHCRKHLTTVSFQNAKSWVQQHGSTCKDCAEIVNNLKKTASDIKEQMVRKAHQLEEWGKNEVVQRIEQLVAQPKKPKKANGK